jgi:hypothetical protein
VKISNIVAYNADARYASIIAGVPDHAIEDVTLSNIRILYRGGGKQELADLQPPERETNYPEPSMFGELPAYGFFIRHAKGVALNGVEISFLTDELRPAFVLDDVNGIDFYHVNARQAENVPTFVLTNVSDFTTRECRGVPNSHFDRVDRKKL